MKWNWQQKDWPNFKYSFSKIKQYEEEFLHNSGLLFSVFNSISNQDKENIKINLISDEALKTSEIEGIYLNRDSVQSSIQKNFGLKIKKQSATPYEQGLSDLMIDIYKNFDSALTNKELFNWHKLLMQGRTDIKNVGAYRTHKEPMVVVSGTYYKEKIHFEAPPSHTVNKEMEKFISWFNSCEKELFTITRAAIAHLYFVSIHPFEDGNGRIARAISQKSISQSLKQPSLLALAITIEKHKKEYYNMLEASNKNNEITDWLVYFAKTMLKAQQYTINLVDFIIFKTKFYDKYKDVLNDRQLKVIKRMFKEGIEGFKGGLSAQNYISITKASRATTTRDLQELVDKKVLLKKGNLKYSRYFIPFPKNFPGF